MCQSDQLNNIIFDPKEDVVGAENLFIVMDTIIIIKNLIEHIVVECTLKILLSMLELDDYYRGQVVVHSSPIVTSHGRT
jgi:hypothetical protein